MRLLKLGELTARVTGGTDREGGGDGPVLVLFHGFGAPGTDLVPLYRTLEVPPEIRFVFPAAPIALDPRAPEEFAPRAWWPIDMLGMQQALARGRGAELARDKPPGLDEARELVTGLLAALEKELAAPLERVVLGGFSQGAMLACDVALRSPRSPAGLVLLSGAPIAVPEWQTLAPARKGLPVLMSHGRSDPVLPFAGGEYLRDLLRDAGLLVDFIAWNGGHGVPDGVLQRLGPFLTARAAERRAG
jgi:phospholipase/carboxylesterase